MENICWQIIVVAFMPPLQYDLWDPAPKNNANTATARRNLDAVITTPKRKNTILKHFLKAFLKGK